MLIRTSLVLLLALAGCGSEPAGNFLERRNLILVIGDGMGRSQIDAASLFATGATGGLSFESLPNRGSVVTGSASGPVTDSAAAATAYATGQKVHNGIISIASPGDGAGLETILESFMAAERRVGLVSTAYISHATPAAFAAHEPSRNNNAEIIADYLVTAPDLLLGGAAYADAASARGAGYDVVSNAQQLTERVDSGQLPIWGQFGGTHLPYEFDGLGDLPHLSQMTQAALELLSRDRRGFFVMIEAGRIDHAGHENDLARSVQETLELEATLDVILHWAEERNDTLIVLTADHETGGLVITGENGRGNLPDVTWSSTGHTATPVPIWAHGPGAENFAGSLDNTEVHSLMLNLSL